MASNAGNDAAILCIICILVRGSREEISKTPTMAIKEEFSWTYARLIGQEHHFTSFLTLPYLFNLLSPWILPHRSHLFEFVIYDTMLKQ